MNPLWSNTISPSVENTSKVGVCYHCGQPIQTIPITQDQRSFCCVGCETVYQLLKDHNLCKYYTLQETPNRKAVKPLPKDQFAYLDLPEIQDQLILFKEGKTSLVSFFLPDIHCSSCIWLLEHLYRVNTGIRRSVVNFSSKEIQIWFSPQEISLRGVAETLTALGYEPIIQGHSDSKTNDHNLLLRLGVAGFCFGNIMLLSFPEYLSLDASNSHQLEIIFSGLIVLLSIPVLFFSGWPYLFSAWKALRRGTITLEVPLALGMGVMFIRSLWDLGIGAGPGFMDTLAGLVFFLLIGRWFQQKVYAHLSFDRNYKSYFPLAVTKVIENEVEEIVPLSHLRIGDKVKIRNQEIIPADSLLITGQGQIDYSFVTGESILQEGNPGDFLYAGGRQTGGILTVQLVKPVSESYLTKLWNHETFHKTKEVAFSGFSAKVSHWFTIAIIGVAVSASAWWLFEGESRRALEAFTAVLIIACPCALALSSPFALGNALRYLERNRLYVKNTATVEAMASLSSIVLDKTGTLTEKHQAEVSYEGIRLGSEASLFSELFKQSVHPLSRILAQWLGSGDPTVVFSSFQEFPGKGLTGVINGISCRAGSSLFVRGIPETGTGTRVWLMAEGQILGCLKIQQPYRKGLGSVIQALRSKYKLNLVSGDVSEGQEGISDFFEINEPVRFSQSPEDKLLFIQKLQKKGNKVLMLGDGLNDAGALKQSEVGIALTEDSTAFTPASDAILEASAFQQLPQMLKFCRNTLQTIYFSFGLSLAYNITGLYFAIQGNMSPLFAAVLMPISSITIIAFTTGMTRWHAGRGGLR